jgi:GcrA cell cycle regulator
MSEWTDKKIEKLKKFWEKGYSAAEIGKKLDFSKNAIVGKVHRLGLSNRSSPIKAQSGASAPASRAAVVKPAKKPEKTPAAAFRPAKPEPVAKSGQKADSSARDKVVSKIKKPSVGISMLELTNDLCCWPIDDVNSENFHFCGKKVFKNKPYCLEHCAVAYTNSSTPLEEREADEGSVSPAEEEE